MLKRIDGRIAGKIWPQNALEDPEVNLDVMFGYGAEGRIASAGGPDGTFARIEALNLDGKYRHSEKRLTLVLSGTVGLGDVEGAVKLGGSRTFNLGDKPDTVALNRDALAKTIALKELVLAHTGELPDCGGFNDRDHPICKAAREQASADNKLEEARSSTWRIRLSAGHMSLGPAFHLIRNLIASLGQ